MEDGQVYKLAPDRRPKVKRPQVKVVSLESQNIKDIGNHSLVSDQVTKVEVQKSAPQKKYFVPIEVLDHSLDIGPPKVKEKVIQDKVIDFFDLASENQNLWKLNKEELKIEETIKLYMKEFSFDPLLIDFLVKLIVFFDGLQIARSSKAFWIKSFDRDGSVGVKNVTLIGQRYFYLLNFFKNYLLNVEIPAYYSNNDFVNFLSYFNPTNNPLIEKKFYTLNCDDANSINTKMLEIKKKWIIYKTKYSKNIENINYLYNKEAKRVFFKDRLVCRFHFQSREFHYDIGKLSIAFAELMKRLQGKNRLSEDIKYIKFANENSVNKFIDVLFFIEPTDKFETIDEIMKSIRDHWAKVIHHFSGNNAVVISSQTLEIDAKKRWLMESDLDLKTEYLYVSSKDDALIKKIGNILIPFFISQAIFFPIQSSVKGIRQLTSVGFGKKYKS